MDSPVYSSPERPALQRNVVAADVPVGRRIRKTVGSEAGHYGKWQPYAMVLTTTGAISRRRLISRLARKPNEADTARTGDGPPGGLVR